MQVTAMDPTISLTPPLEFAKQVIVRAIFVKTSLSPHNSARLYHVIQQIVMVWWPTHLRLLESAYTGTTPVWPARPAVQLRN